MRLVIGLAFLLACLSARAAEPEQMAVQYAEASMLDQWESAMSLTCPLQLKKLRAYYTREFSSTLGRILRLSTMGDTTDEEMARFSDQQFAARVMKVELPYSTTKDRPRIEVLKTTVLGTVPEGADTLHVLYRQEVLKDGKEKFSGINVLTTNREEGRWCVALRQDIALRLPGG